MTFYDKKSAVRVVVSANLNFVRISNLTNDRFRKLGWDGMDIGEAI
jgi:hypothetical protein